MNIKKPLSYCLLTLAMLAAPSLHAANTAEVSNQKTSEMTITLQEFVTREEKELKANIIVAQVDANLKVQIPIHKESLNYGQFLTLLNINGFTAYKSQDYIQVIRNRDARSAAIPIVEKDKTYYDDEYVTDYLKPEKACAFKVLSILRPLVAQYGFLALDEDTHTLIIVDVYSNVKRIKAIMKTIEDNLDSPQDCSNAKQPEFKPEKKS